MFVLKLQFDSHLDPVSGTRFQIDLSAVSLYCPDIYCCSAVNIFKLILSDPWLYLSQCLITSSGAFTPFVFHILFSISIILKAAELPYKLHPTFLASRLGLSMSVTSPHRPWPADESSQVYVSYITRLVWVTCRWLPSFFSSACEINLNRNTHQSNLVFRHESMSREYFLYHSRPPLACGSV